jgi:hypothetical protein
MRLSSKLAFAAVAVLGLAALLLVSKRRESEIARGLPPRIVCASLGDALAQAGAGATPVLGRAQWPPGFPLRCRGLTR